MSRTAYFATAVPGIGQVLAREIAQLADTAVEPNIAFDGRNDVVMFQAEGSSDILCLRTAEDVFVQASKSQGAVSLRAVGERLVDEPTLNRALSVYSTRVRPLKARMTFRVVTRLLSERAFLRTQLRDEVTRRVQECRPRWRVADPADIELWVLETKPGVMRLALRLSDRSMRHRGGRASERPGALRPTVAAAMLLLTDAESLGGRLLDPCCGSGTVLMEAQSRGLQLLGVDIDADAARTARTNLQQRAFVIVADARHIPFADNTASSVVSNLPFGQRFQVQGDPERWFGQVLNELARVSTPDARIGLLAPATKSFERSLVRQGSLDPLERIELRLLGMRAVLWSLKPV
jgi:23S rRNA G2445 N2-methylase RlmL